MNARKPVPSPCSDPARKPAQVPHGDSRFVALSAASRAPLRHFTCPIANRVDSCELAVFISRTKSVKTVKTMKNEQRKYLKFQKVAGNSKNGFQKFEALLNRKTRPAMHYRAAVLFHSFALSLTPYR